MVKDFRQPLTEEIDIELSPLSAFEFFRNRQFSFFLDSGMDPNKLGRYSFMGSDPFLVLSSYGSEVILTQGTEQRRANDNPFDVLIHRLLSLSSKMQSACLLDRPSSSL